MDRNFNKNNTFEHLVAALEKNETTYLCEPGFSAMFRARLCGGKPLSLPVKISTQK